MSTVTSFRELEVWQRAIELAVLAYQEVRRMPRPDQFALGTQLIGCSSSIAANIAEGFGRVSRAEYLRFLDIANGSRCEFESRLEVCKQARVIEAETAGELRMLSERVGQMLTRLRQRLRRPR